MRRYISNIYFSRSFRRLASKTQLYSNYDNDHFHNRITHTIEVRNIANRIRDRVGNLGNQNIVEAIAISHDLGHTPFGHAGERALNDITYQVDNLRGAIVPEFTNKILFKHNYYSAKVALGINYNGIRIEKILAGIILHTNLDYSRYKLTDSDKQSTIKYYLKNYPRRFKVISLVSRNFIEAKIVSLADEIAQRLSDFHDLLLSKDYIIDNGELEIILPQNYLSMVDGYPSSFKIKRIIELLEDFYINGVSFNTVQNDFIIASPQQSSMDYVKSVVDKKIKTSTLVATFDKQADVIIKNIFKKLYKNPKWIDEKMTSTIAKRVLNICNNYKDKVEMEKIIPKYYSYYCTSDTISSKNKLLKTIYNVVHSNKTKNLKGEEKIFLKEINSELVYSIVFYIANMTDRYALDKNKKLKNVKKMLKTLLTSL